MAKPEAPDVSAIAKIVASPGGFAKACDSRFQLPPHLQVLNQKLVDLCTGRIRRLIVQMPPRHGKSELCSKFTPAWFLGLWPNKRVILASYEATFAESWGRKARDIYDEYGPQLFGRRVRDDLRTASVWGVEGFEGSMQTAGVGGPMTGKGADLLIIDDPVKNDTEALSKTYREKAWNWYCSVARTRIEPGGSIMIVMTRWHHDDLAGRCISGMDSIEGEREKWEVVDFPAIATGPDILGRKTGDPLWAARYDVKALDAIRSTLGPSWWSALFQQQPVPESGGLVKKEWFRYYRVSTDGFVCGGETIDYTDLTRFQTCDLAISTKERSDWTVIQTWGYSHKHDKLLLLDQVRKRMEAPEILESLKSKHRQFKSSAVWVERVAFQLALVQLLRNDRIPVRELEADRDKSARLYAAAPMFEAGKVWFPAECSWMPTLETELLQFPAGAHDDQVDALAYAVAYACPRSFAGIAPDVLGRHFQFPKGLMVNAPGSLM